MTGSTLRNVLNQFYDSNWRIKSRREQIEHHLVGYLSKNVFCSTLHVITERACNRAQVSMAAASAKRIRYLRSRKHFSEIARRHHAHKLPCQMLIY